MTRFTLALVLILPLAAAYADGGALSTIQKNGVIRLGHLRDAPPFSFADDKGPQGYSVELCKHVARSIQRQLNLTSLRIEWVPLTLQERIPAVRDHRVDIECGTTTWTLSRQQEVDFSLMTFVDGATVLVRSASDMLRLADLQGKKVAVVPTTTTAGALQAAMKGRMLNFAVVAVSSPEEGIAKLQQGAVDGYASDRLVLIGQGLASKAGSSLRVLDEDFSVEPYALVLARGDPDFRLAIDRSLATLYRSGEIETIFNRWLGPLGRPSTLLTALYYLQSIPE
ncbi:MAG TPA: amino acid ABC transporter substrate-binding protein [Burkholderiales bacterium]|nr:amino acid ABC transporter substrate-binding protein [Burkholderiales bacterium]